MDTPGKILIRDALPEDMQHYADSPIDKKAARRLFTELAENHQEKYVDTLKQMMESARHASTDYGDTASISIHDLRIPPKTAKLREEIRGKVKEITQSPALSLEEKNKKVADYLRPRIKKVYDTLMEEGFASGNRFAIAGKLGHRGNPAQVTQLLFGDLLVADPKGRAIPIAGLHSYSEGVTPAEYWSGAYGSRKGMQDVQFMTAQIGYFGKQLALMANRERVTEADCGASQRGIARDPKQDDVMGLILAKDVGPLKAGTRLGEEHAKYISREKEVVTRSPMTCRAKEGVCQKCVGAVETGKLPPVGEFVGITSARVLSEPMLQTLGLSAKHVGGAVGTNDQNMSSFDEINQFFQVPQHFKQGASLSPADGRISKIVKAPQGGHYIQVGSEQIYAPINREIKVKVGDSVESGDPLTDGMINPAEMVGYKGIGATRSLVARNLREMLEKNGVPSDLRNLDIMAKSFVNRVRITAPEGVGDYTYDSVVPYSEFEKTYVQRKGQESRKLTNATGMYLEAPVMQYSIGTRVTPSVKKELASHGISEVSVHRDPPAFKPEVGRLAGSLEKDQDWKVRLAGFHLKKSFLDSATKGSMSSNKSSSYIPAMMDPRKNL